MPAATPVGARRFASPSYQALPSPAVFPSARISSMAAYDVARDRAVLFGGYNGSNLADTWTFDGTRWAARSTPTAPSVRNGAQMAYNAATGRTVLFGGYDGSRLLGDTWSWDGSSWTRLSPAVSPTARAQGVMAFSAALGRLVLFGGFDGAYRNDTWTFDGVNWTPVSATPVVPARTDAALAYDADAGQLVLYGGTTAAGEYLGDTWTYGASGWSQAGPVHHPGPRQQHAMAYDPVLKRVVLFGGVAPDEERVSQFYSSTWLWDGADWQVGSVPLSPSPRAGMELVPSAGKGQLMLFGGRGPDNSMLSDTQLYDWQGLGSPKGDTLEGRSIDDRSSYAVNVGNGNLTVASSDLRVAGVGVPLAVNRVYNAKAPGSTVSVGRGWYLTTGRDVYLSGLPDGSQVLYGYAGAAGQLHFVRKPDGSFTSPPGMNAALAAGTVGGISHTLTLNESAEVLSFGTPQNNGLLARHADRNGNAITFAYNTALQLTEIIDTQARRYTLAYSGAGQLASITDPTARVVRYTQDVNGYLTQFVDATGAVTGYDYDSDGRLARVRDPAAVGCLPGNSGDPGDGSGAGTGGNRCDSATWGTTGVPTGCVAPDGTDVCGTFFGYDSAFNLTSVRNSFGGLTVGYAYGAPDPATDSWVTTTSTNGRQASTTYDASYAGPVTRVTDALGRLRPATFNANGDVLTVADATGVGNTPGNTTSYTYNSNNSPRSVASPTGATSYLGYGAGDSLGGSRTCATSDSSHRYLPKCAADAQGNQSLFTYDGPGNQLSAASASLGTLSTSSYNPPAGQAPTCGGKPGQVCSSTDARGNRTAFGYDSVGNLTTVTPPAPLGVTRTTFDALGRTATVTDGKGQVSRLTYDAKDHVTRTLTGGATGCSYPAGTCLTVTFDANGNPTSRSDRTGVTGAGYDALNRQHTKTLPGGATFRLAYDAAGNLTRNTDPGGTVVYTYDLANQLSTLAEPGGSCTIPNSSPAQDYNLSNPAPDSAKCTLFRSDNNGLRVVTRFPGATFTQVTPDRSGRVAQISSTQGSAVGPTLSDVRYTYTVGGADTSQTQTRTDAVTGRVTSYSYDALNQLAGAQERAGSTTTGSWTYCYDKAGNRTGESTVVGATCANPATTYSHNAANQLTARNASTTGWAYDANGNELAALAGPGQSARTAAGYSPSNQLTTLTAGGASTPFGYAGLGHDERVQAGTTSYQNGPEGLANQSVGGAAATSFTRDPSGGLISLRSGGKSYYYLFDGLGSVVGLVNSTGGKVNSYSYDPYGKDRGKTEGVPNPFRFTGGYLDTATGLYKLGIRYYDPTLGRFTQPDPTGQDPHYTYAGNNPVNYVDPTGAVITSVIKGLKAVETALAPVAAVAVGAFLVSAGVGLCLSGFGCVAGAAVFAVGLGNLAAGGYLGYRAGRKL